MDSYQTAKENLVKMLENEIEILSELGNTATISVNVQGIPMEFDSEILLREKKKELENVEIYYERILEITPELIENGQTIGALNKETSEEVNLFLKGVKFTFNKESLMKDLEKKKEALLSEMKEIKSYFETGKRMRSRLVLAL